MKISVWNYWTAGDRVAILRHSNPMPLGASYGNAWGGNCSALFCIYFGCDIAQDRIARLWWSIIRFYVLHSTQVPQKTSSKNGTRGITTNTWGLDVYVLFQINYTGKIVKMAPGKRVFAKTATERSAKLISGTLRCSSWFSHLTWGPTWISREREPQLGWAHWL